MRFMMLMIPGGYESAPPGQTPDAEQVKAMLAYNTALQKAGVLRSLEGLYPPATGARVSFAGGQPQVRHGPFAETRETLGGFWLIDVASQDDAIAWAQRCPAAANEVIEVRRVQEMEDFPPDIQKAVAGLTDMQTRPPLP